MSRALDEEISNSFPTLTIYKSIASVLGQDRSSLLEIELLGKSHQLPTGEDYLLEGNSLAIPKVKLVQAFVVARQTFFKLMKDYPDEKSRELRDATAVILLMDPEHLTAANSRKRLIQSLRKGSRENLVVALKKELQFVDSYLTARLHRHTKSPTLWSHRRWILLQCESVDLKIDIRRHLEVVLVAAERHPRNYYAWSHMRWLQTLPNDNQKKAEIVSLVKSWCLRNPSDTSGFSFLLFCLASTIPSQSVFRAEEGTSVCKEVLHLAVSFKWTHESVWVFLRTLIASGDMKHEQSLAFIKQINGLLSEYPNDLKAQRLLRNTLDWSQTFNRVSELKAFNF